MPHVVLAEKLKILQLEIVLLLLKLPGVKVVEPEEKIPFAGFDAPSRMSQLSIRLLSLPFKPVVVLNKTTPSTVEVLTPASVQNRTMLFEPSLMKRIASPVVLRLLTVSSFDGPTPPGRPSTASPKTPPSPLPLPPLPAPR